MKWQKEPAKSDSSKENPVNSNHSLLFDDCQRHLPSPAGMIKNQNIGEVRARIISPDAGQNLIASGWRAADLHVHTFYSYDVVPVAEVDPLVLYDKAKARGMSFVTFTDHDTMKAYDRIGWTRDDVVSGVEVKILDEKKVGHTIHLNIYTLTRFQFEEIERIARQAKDIELLLEFLRSEKLPHTFNHPFWHEPGETLNTQAVIEVAKLFPVLEYNLGRVNKLNRMVLELASSSNLNKGIVAGTDTHIGDIGHSYTVAEGQSFLGFFEAIESGQSFLISEDLTYSKIKQEMLKRLEMLIDSQSWTMEPGQLKMESGNTLVDAAIKTLSYKSGNSHRIKKFIVKFLAWTLSQTGIPAWVYLRQQKILADRLEHELSYV